MTNRLERVMAYLDGEMDPADRRDFESEMASDPTLAAEVAAHRDLAARLADAYDPVAEEPVPLRLKLAAEAANDRGARWRQLTAAAGMAVTLGLGVIAGRTVLAPEPPIGVGTVVPAGTELARALDVQLAAERGPVQIALTFRDAGGQFCRTFMSRPDALAGLACRGDDGWRVRTATAWAAADTPQYRTAASDTPPEVLAAVDRALAGETLDAAQERAARDGKWR